MSTSRPYVLSVGQCGYDHRVIASHLVDCFGARVTPAATANAALEQLRMNAYDLVLVNRVGERDGASGLDLIRTLKADPALEKVPVMLVSNYDDAQTEAVSLGALPGFGKAQLREAQTRERLARALHRYV